MRKTLYILLGTLLLATSCKELFLPDDIQSTEKILVVQGIICEGNAPIVNLSWALGYYGNKTEYITDATVYITDDHSNNIVLAESSAGNYTDLSNNYKGTIGQEYTLHVITPDGFEYASSPVYMHKKPEIDSLYADPGTRTVYTYNSLQEPVPELQEGLYIFSRISKKADSTLYFRFKTSVMKESTYVLDPLSLNATTIYVWDNTYLDNIYSVDFSIGRDGMQIVPEHEAGYIPHLYDPASATAAATAPLTIGWVLTYRVYAISPDVYDYYNSMVKQLNSNDQLFAPLPSQIKSNMHCMSDPDKTVTGVFEASSADTIYKAFSFRNLNIYKSILLPNFPEGIESGESKDIPDFWVNF